MTVVSLSSRSRRRSASGRAQGEQATPSREFLPSSIYPSSLRWIAHPLPRLRYCFCTKYLPRLIAAAIAEPSPSVYASPYDLILRGACSLSLAQYYLGSRPDQAILLRNAYYRKCYRATKMVSSTSTRNSPALHRLTRYTTPFVSEDGQYRRHLSSADAPPACHPHLRDRVRFLPSLDARAESAFDPAAQARRTHPRNPRSQDPGLP